ncbi:hypothetical protein [Faecalibacterium sp. IP-1-18]|uniref:hypothetical protein n=1 Tax=Faecalibacterium sp. IP-1-18 TaxID=2929488 RepID=UPI002014FDE1|nr:hypothetical protein [Faecalibacterium sp. IP-1-18]UQK52921.1 hypothetical protein MTP43_08895 [Faecalibacterium sp. IP-1-18]
MAIEKYKMTPVGATPALAGISRRGHFFTTAYHKVQPCFELLFALRHKLLQNFVVLKKLAVVFFSKVCYTMFREVLYSLSARSPGWHFYNVSLFAF